MTLHDEELRVVDVQLDRAEEVPYAVGLGDGSVQHVLAFAPHQHLATDRDLFEVLEARGTLFGVAVVERYVHYGLVDARLALLIDQVLQTSHSHLRSSCVS